MTLRYGRGLGIVVFSAALWGVGAYAATPEETQSTLDSVQATLAQSNARISDIAQALQAAQAAQVDISARLVDLGKTIDAQEAAIADDDGHIKTLQVEAVSISSDLAARQDELSLLLSGLTRLQQNPPPALVVDPDHVLDALRGAMLMGTVVPEFHGKAKELRDKLDELQAVRDEIETSKDRKNAAITALEASQVQLNALQDQKKAFAEAASRNLAAEKLNSATLATKAKDLEQLLSDLQKAKGEAEKRQAADTQAVADAAARVTAEAAAKVEAERQAALLGTLKPLSSLKGQLPYPVAGDVIRHFGDDTGFGTKLEGLALATAPAAQVISPVDGKVEFAGSFRSYGQLLILDAGEGYLVLLAGMKQISTELGQTVRVGEPVGTMGEGPSTLALLGDTADHSHPVFYVEFRKDNAPVDSTAWWDAGKREAMR
jgi:murein hydrolase activator